MTETYYTIRQVAERFGVSYQTIWALVRDGEIESLKIKTAIRIPERALVKLAGDRPVKP